MNYLREPLFLSLFLNLTLIYKTKMVAISHREVLTKKCSFFISTLHRRKIYGVFHLKKMRKFNLKNPHPIILKLIAFYACFI